MRVVTWNVQHACRPDSGATDPLALAATCVGFAADVIALQEVDRGTGRVRGADLLEIAADATGLTPVDGAAFEFDGGTFGNALLVRGDPEDCSVVALPRPWRAEQRALVSCRLDGVVVGCCHLGLGRGEAARQLGAVLRALPATGPGVLLGDLNLGPPSVSAVLSAAGAAWSQLDVGPSFPAHAPDRAIDHVLVRAVRSGAARVAPAAPVGDHRPVVADVDLG